MLELGDVSIRPNPSRSHSMLHVIAFPSVLTAGLDISMPDRESKGRIIYEGIKTP